MSEITPGVRKILLRQFLNSWNSWNYPEKPHCCWICEFDWNGSTRPDEIAPLTWARRVWLLDEAGFHTRNPLDWRRFEILRRDFGVALGQPRARINEIGLGCFAPTHETDFFYYDQLWGPLWGMGSTIQINAAGEIRGGQRIWVS